MKERLEQMEYVGIAKKIILMAEKDQSMREWSFNERGENDKELRVRKLRELDSLNTVAMKEIIEKYGWPTISKVGEKASKMAWLLVQHADAETEFQKKCLALMRDQPEGEVDKMDVAYLEDRVRVHDGKPQIYGTQFYTDGKGNFGPRPIEDVNNLEQRRKEVGLGSFEEYKVQMGKRWGSSKH